jgi:membrane protease subunit (stomatin/prohibitin family)
MAFWDKIKSQFIDVIEWADSTHDTLVWKFPHYDNAIKNGAQLVVREGQAAAFLFEGQLGDVFKAGRHVLTTSNIPILTTLKNWKYAFNEPFKCDVFFVSTRQFTGLKWGTPNPIMLRDPEFGPIRLRAFGSYCIQVKEPGAFIRQISGTNTGFETADISNYLRDLLVSRFADALGESKIAALDLAANYTELGGEINQKLQPEFEEYGLTLTKFLVENISFPPEVEAALDQRSKMGVLGNMQQYTQMKTAEAIGDMANNPGSGGGMMGMIGGMNMGGIVGGAMQAGMQNQQSAPVAPPPLPGAAQFFAAINSQQAGPFDLNALKGQAVGGNLTRETLVWKQGMANWLPAGQVPELAGVFSAPPPLPA